MYHYMQGVVTDILSNAIILENNKIGYLIYTANPYSFEIGKSYQIYLYQQIKEDEHLLFGFQSKEEKELFLKLIGVKGLGPKMALPMLATGSPSGIMDAIERENILYLKKFPKIGDKLAKQMILDLKGKLSLSDDSITVNHDYEELCEVLKGLGYKPAEIKKVLPKIQVEMPIEEQIKEALKLMLK